MAKRMVLMLAVMGVFIAALGLVKFRQVKAAKQRPLVELAEPDVTFAVVVAVAR